MKTQTESFTCSVCSTLDVIKRQNVILHQLFASVDVYKKMPHFPGDIKLHNLGQGPGI